MGQWLAFTNQKLYQCRLLAEQASVAEPAELAQALEDAALYQLWMAYRSYLNELGEMVSLSMRADSLAHLMQEVRLVTGEMKELAQLEADGFSWLGQFLAAVEHLGWPGPVARPADHNLIAVANQPASAGMAIWYRELDRLIDRQRDNRQES